jgi:hypothetical protein
VSIEPIEPAVPVVPVTPVEPPAPVVLLSPLPRDVPIIVSAMRPIIPFQLFVVVSGSTVVVPVVVPGIVPVVVPLPTNVSAIRPNTPFYSCVCFLPPCPSILVRPLEVLLPNGHLSNDVEILIGRTNEL